MSTLKSKSLKAYLAALILCFVFLLGTSTFMVVLEGPQLGSFLWIIMGLIISIRMVDQKEATERA
jgi:hypothetical protein